MKLPAALLFLLIRYGREAVQPQPMASVFTEALKLWSRNGGLVAILLFSQSSLCALEAQVENARVFRRCGPPVRVQGNVEAAWILWSREAEARLLRAYTSASATCFLALPDSWIGVKRHFGV